MDINLSPLTYTFKQKPLLIGGKAKEYYNVRRAGNDIDFVVSDKDYSELALLYPDNQQDLGGDLGIVTHGFEIWKTICHFDYDFLSEKAIELEDYKIISLEKLLFLTALAMKKPKYEEDLKLIVQKILELQKDK